MKTILQTENGEVRIDGEKISFHYRNGIQSLLKDMAKKLLALEAEQEEWLLQRANASKVSELSRLRAEILNLQSQEIELLRKNILVLEQGCFVAKIVRK